MMKVKHDRKRTAAQKVALFKQFFMGRSDVYGTHDPVTGRGWQEKSPVTDAVILAHLKGQKPYGVYLLEVDMTPAAVVDFDNGDAQSPLGFVARMKAYGIPAYIERSKSKGYHVWMFFEKGGITAKKARRVIRFVLEQMGCPDVEVFPKQDYIDSDKAYGNFINAPLFFLHVREDRTVFVDDNMRTHPNQWDFLESIRRVPVEALDKVIQEHDLLKANRPSKDGPPKRTEPDSRTFGLQPCAQRMLAEGVKENQRSACFRLAAQLRKAGLPADCALAALKVWATRNRPADDKAIISSSEVEDQTECAYRTKEYRACGCQDEAVRPFCDPSCSLYGARQGGHG